MEDLDTFLTALSVMIDDLCKEHHLCLPSCPGPTLSCSEVLTFSRFGQWARFASERAFSRFARRHLRAAFPLLPDPSQFLRQEHATSLIEQIACLLAEHRPDATEALSPILGVTGVPIRSIKRRESGWLVETADKGWCSRISSHLGFPVLMASTPTGFLIDFGFSPASVHDTRLADTFLAVRARPNPRLSGIGLPVQVPYMADCAFTNEALQLRWLHDYQAAVLPIASPAWSPLQAFDALCRASVKSSKRFL